MTRRQPEAAIQRAVIQHLRLRGPRDAVAFHVPNGGQRSAVEGAIFRGFGVMPGIPDVLIVHDGRLFALELKADGQGYLSSAQREAQELLQRAGATVGTAAGIDAAVSMLAGWGLLRGGAR